jgi:hypothetical protein
MKNCPLAVGFFAVSLLASLTLAQNQTKPDQGESPPE